jgi:hypothetical protein
MGVLRAEGKMLHPQPARKPGPRARPSAGSGERFAWTRWSSIELCLRMRPFVVATFLILYVSLAVSQQQAPTSTSGNQHEMTHGTEQVSAPSHDKKSSADWWLVRFTAALFVAALLQFGAMWIHALTLHRTLNATRLIGEAAATLARASAIQLRAQLIVQVHYPIQGLTAGQSPHVGLDIFNRGLSPAHECTYETWIAVVPHPFTDFPPNADYFRVPSRSTVYPTHVPVGVAIDLSHDLTQNQMVGIQQNLWRLCFRIHLEYRDVFGEQRFANFAYSANDHAIEPLPRYNDSN